MVAGHPVAVQAPARMTFGRFVLGPSLAAAGSVSNALTQNST